MVVSLPLSLPGCNVEDCLPAGITVAAKPPPGIVPGNQNVVWGHGLTFVRLPLHNITNVVPSAAIASPSYNGLPGSLMSHNTFPSVRE